MNAKTHLSAFNVKGGTHSLTRRPTTEFAAQRSGGTTKRAAVARVRGGFTDEVKGIRFKEKSPHK